MDEVKRWRCKEGHVMGFVMRNGSGIRQLILLREALSTDFDHGLNGLPEVEVMAIVEGYAADVRCSVCGGVRTWVPGAEAIRALMRKSEEG